MAQRSRVLCKYFMHGACYKGESCEFSHNWDDPASNVCIYYQRGYCSYGSKCRYEHVKVQNPKVASAMAKVLKAGTIASASSSPAGSASTPVISPVSVRKSVSLGGSSKGLSSTSKVSPAASTPVAASNPITIKSPSVIPAGLPSLANSYHGEGSGKFSSTSSSPSSRWQNTPKTLDDELYSIEQEIEVARLLHEDDPADEPICTLGLTGSCTRGSACTHVHGDLCPTCGKNCLHPLRAEEREEHLRVCAQNRKRLEAMLISQDIECVVCLERVLSKPALAERKFGILSGCDHPFCISCVRSWRNGSHPPGMDLKTIIRGCPVCRTVSHYVIPSLTWFSSPDEKAEIVNGYKKKLSSLDCRYFDQGNGNCPFGTSCFYKHAYKDGRLEEIKLRHLGAADGSAVITKNIRLSDFIGKLDLDPRRSG
ncbi:E3 ubiquitin-protein ligase makorin [Marchantia polymorpha subsp. ruderalis]